MIPGIETIDDLKGKRVLVRSSLNVPIEDGRIVDVIRIDKSIPTITFLKDAGAKVILISHLSGGPDRSLRPVYEYLKEKMELVFIEDMMSDEGKGQIGSLKEGDVCLCENIRRYDGEEKNDPMFARELAELADIFVNDDFTSAHRSHASVVGLPAYLPSFMGFLFEKEYSFLERALTPPSPSLVIVGGAKPETKIPLIASLAKRVTTMYVAGISANALYEEKGMSIGLSSSATETIPGLSEVAVLPNVRVPVDVRIIDAQGSQHSVAAGKVQSDSRIVDAGPQTVNELRELVSNAAFVLWNGPVGDYEKGFIESTHAIAHMLSDAKAETIVGGGDTLAAIKGLKLNDKFTFVSTAGGALIDFLAHGTLPGIEALKKSPKASQ